MLPLSSMFPAIDIKEFLSEGWGLDEREEVFLVNSGKISLVFKGFLW